MREQIQVPLFHVKDTIGVYCNLYHTKHLKILLSEDHVSNKKVKRTGAVMAITIYGSKVFIVQINCSILDFSTSFFKKAKIERNHAGQYHTFIDEIFSKTKFNCMSQKVEYENKDTTLERSLSVSRSSRMLLCLFVTSMR